MEFDINIDVPYEHFCLYVEPSLKIDRFQHTREKNVLSKSKTDENVYMIVNVNPNFDYHGVFPFTSDLGATFKNLPQKILSDVYKPGGTGLSRIADQKTSFIMVFQMI